MLKNEEFSNGDVKLDWRLRTAALHRSYQERKTLFCRFEARENCDGGGGGAGRVGVNGQGAASLSFSRPSCPPLLAMASRMQMAALTCLSLLLLWSQVPGAQGQKFQFGPCQVKGVLPQKLWEAFWAVKDTMQAQDNITSVRLLRQEVLQNVSAAESCYLVHTLLEFYLKTVFKNYHDRTVEVRTLKSFSTLANNFVLIGSQLQPSQENEMFAIRDSAHRRFLLFRRAFKQLDMEAALTKALGEVDVLLTWMQKFYKF
ncbi:interleukin-24 [Sapajus apella]|uniref:Interleukin-24 n=1 Tax=Sapajus apella TaxID=9515 RepID=A0A6J3IS67_SAPAP|nr:interleukin-24 [Sapajus apella]